MLNNEACERGQLQKNRSPSPAGWCAYSLPHHLSECKLSRLFLEALVQMLGIADLPIHWLPPCASWEVFVNTSRIAWPHLSVFIFSVLGNQKRNKWKKCGWLALGRRRLFWHGYPCWQLFPCVLYQFLYYKNWACVMGRQNGTESGSSSLSEQWY